MHNKGTRRGDASDDHRAAAGPNPAGVLSSCRRNEGCVARSFRTASSPDSTDYHDHKTPAPVGAMHPSSEAQPIAAAWSSRTYSAIETREASPAPFRIPPPAKKQHPSPPWTGRGSRGGATAPTHAMPRIAHVCARWSRQPATGPPDGQGISGIIIVDAHGTNHAGCFAPTDVTSGTRHPRTDGTCPVATRRTRHQKPITKNKQPIITTPSSPRGSSP